jgi:hypothetical protein
MNKYKNSIITMALLLYTISGSVCVGDILHNTQDGHEFTVVASVSVRRSSYRSVSPLFSDCTRNRVIWSGGIARRGPDRISPRPIRSRWQGADESRIYCSGGNPFTQMRVADEIWIR